MARYNRMAGAVLLAGSALALAPPATANIVRIGIKQV